MAEVVTKDQTSCRYINRILKQSTSATKQATKYRFLNEWVVNNMYCLLWSARKTGSVSKNKTKPDPEPPGNVSVLEPDPKLSDDLSQI